LFDSQTEALLPHFREEFIMKSFFTVVFCCMFSVAACGDISDTWRPSAAATTDPTPSGGGDEQDFRSCTSHLDCASWELCNSQGQCVIPGPAGKDGQNGTDGKDGIDGKGLTPCATSADCGAGEVCSPSAHVCTVPGADGQDGEDGQDGTTCDFVDNGDGTATFNCTDDTSFTVENGKDGVDGQDGQNGTDGKDGADGQDGQDGTDGKDGQDGKGLTPCATSADCATGEVCSMSAHVCTVPGADGEDGQDGTTCDFVDNGDCTFTVVCSTGVEFVVNNADCTVPECASDAECDDENGATLDWCDGTGTCHNTLVDCDDSNVCTTDTFTGSACVHTPVECAEGLFCDPASGQCVSEEPTCRTLTVTADWQFQGVVGPIGSDTWPTGEWKSCPNDQTGSDEPCQTLTWCGEDAVLFNVQATPAENPAWAITGQWSGTDWCGSPSVSEEMFVGNAPSDLGCEVVCGPDGYLDWLCLPPE
jgi:hypothetical protein